MPRNWKVTHTGTFTTTSQSYQGLSEILLALEEPSLPLAICVTIADYRTLSVVVQVDGCKVASRDVHYDKHNGVMLWLGDWPPLDAGEHRIEVKVAVNAEAGAIAYAHQCTLHVAEIRDEAAKLTFTPNRDGDYVLPPKIVEIAAPPARPIDADVCRELGFQEGRLYWSKLLDSEQGSVVELTLTPPVEGSDDSWAISLLQDDDHVTLTGPDITTEPQLRKLIEALEGK